MNKYIFYPGYQDGEYVVPEGSLFKKWIWKVVFSTILLIILKGWEVHFFIRKFWKSFSDFISDFVVVAESFYKDLWELSVASISNHGELSPV